MSRAHRAVIFAIAQLSCLCCTDENSGRRFQWYPVYRGSRRDISFYLSQLHGHSGVVNLHVDVIDSLGSTRHALNASVLFANDYLVWSILVKIS